MKFKQKIDFLINSFLIIIGLIIIVLGNLKYDNVKIVFIGIMLSYAVLNLIQFLLTKKSKDYEGLYTFLASLSIAIVDIFFAFDNVNVLAISLMSWVSIMSVIKFLKSDYYNDNKDKMWKLRIILLILFMITGILTSISFNYPENIQIIVLGYFFLIHGILELVDPITKYLIGK